MPEFNEDGTKKHQRPCAGVKEDLIECLKSSDCMQFEHKSAKECLTSHHPSVEECHKLRILFFECKRSLQMCPTALLTLFGLVQVQMLLWLAYFHILDNRTRFRGHKGY